MSTERETVCVIGLGKIGLSLAAVYASRGYQVIGADINHQTVMAVNSGECPVKNEPGLPELVKSGHKSGLLKATTDTANAVSSASIVVVIVPVLLDREKKADYRFIDLAVDNIGKGIKPGTLVIFETTLPTGDTKNRFGQAIEQRSGLKMGKDFQLGYSPERVYSNRILGDLKKYPKIVGGLDQPSLKRAAAFYADALECKVQEVSSLETAEFSKVAECVYRDVNIALANELALFAEAKGVNMDEVIAASNSQPYSHIHKPGIGVGGHCIPIYPHFFISRGMHQGLTTSARERNDSMARTYIHRLEEVSGSLSGRNVLILGLSFRENVKETTKSSALLLINQLKELGANAYIHDPHYTADEIKAHGAEPLTLQAETTADIDTIIIQAYHNEFKSIDFKQFPRLGYIVDGRNVLSSAMLKGSNAVYIALGRTLPDEGGGN